MHKTNICAYINVNVFQTLRKTTCSTVHKYLTIYWIYLKTSLHYQRRSLMRSTCWKSCWRICMVWHIFVIRDMYSLQFSFLHRLTCFFLWRVAKRTVGMIDRLDGIKRDKEIKCTRIGQPSLPFVQINTRYACNYAQASNFVYDP